MRSVSATAKRFEIEKHSIERQLAALPGYDPQYNLRAGFHSHYAASADEPQWVQVDLGAEFPIDQIALVPAGVILEGRAVASYGFPRQFRVELADNFECRNSVVVFDSRKQPAPELNGYPFLIPEVQSSGRYVRVTCTELASVDQSWCIALGELLVISGNRNLAAWRPVASSGSVEADLRWSVRYLVDAISALSTPAGIHRSPTDGFQSAPHEEPPEFAWLEIDLGEVHDVDEVRLIPARPTDRPDVPGWGFPLSFTVELRRDAQNESTVLLYDCSRYELRHWLHSPLVIPVGSRPFFTGRTTGLGATRPRLKMPVDAIPARFVRINANRLDRRIQPPVLAFAEIQVYSGSQNIAARKSVTASDVAAEEHGDRWSLSAVNDGFDSRRQLMELPEWLRKIDERRMLTGRLAIVDRELQQATQHVLQQARWGLGTLLVAAVGTVMVVNYRLRRSHRHQTHRLRTQIASDLHDDIGSNLGTIALLCETLMNDELTATQRNSLNEIREIATDTSDAMRDIVWIMQPESTRLEDFVGRLRRTATRLLPNHDLVFDAPIGLPDGVVSLIWRRNVFLAIKELIHNVVKHAKPSAVEIQIRVRQRNFEVTISDNGQTFQQRAQSQGLGLKSVQRRLEELRGRMNVVTDSNRGTTTTIEVPLPQLAAWSKRP